ncbi:MAG TPA: response regulator [Anaerolineae bacterium]|nr:response regulator [Anaerolineae bacterium]
MMTGDNKINILIVDDEENVAAALAASLKRSKNYHVDIAHSGPEALNQVEKKLYALVITDYRMPGLTGVELAQGIKSLSPTTQVMLMTAYGTNNLQEVVDGLQLDGYIDKPISVSKIREIVSNALDQTKELDKYRTGEKKVAASASQYLNQLQKDTNAFCVLLLSYSGYPIESAGQVQALDIGSISALVAANFLAAIELSKMLGNTTVFKSSYHEGPDYDIFAHEIDNDHLLAVIFGANSKSGMVRFYTKRAIDVLAEVLSEPLEEPAEAADLKRDLADNIDNKLDDFFLE